MYDSLPLLFCLYERAALMDVCTIVIMAAGEFSHFVGVCENVRLTASKNAKVTIISEYFSSLDESSLPIAVLFLSGNVFPKGTSQALNIGFTTIMVALSEIARLDETEIQKIYLKHGDMGALAEYAVSKKHTTPLLQQQLTLPSIYENFKKIAASTGAGSAEIKKKIISGMLISCHPLGAKYLVKIMTGEMRIGTVEGIVELAIAKAFGRDIKQIRQALLVSGDITHVSLLAKSDALSSVMMKPLVPLSFMLADVMFSAEEIMEYYQKPLICEYKYDGIRVQMHKHDGKVRMFSRKLEDITNSFPEIAAACVQLKGDFILDGEILAFRDARPLHFQELQKRLRRKLVTKEMMDKIPVIYTAYDVMYYNVNEVIDKTLADRKKILSAIQFKGPIVNSGYKIAASVPEIVAYFDESREIGHEGLVLKDPESQYHLGKRGRYWVKLKKELDTIDAVIVMAEYGHGKRAGTLSDYTFAVKDGDGKLKTIGKAYSGLTDKEIAEITAKLRSLTLRDQGTRLLVKPEIVLEVAFDSIQKSDRHNSGYALRFPRIKYIRSDKSVNDIDTLKKVKLIYERQAHVRQR